MFRVALCMEACTPCFGSGTCQVYGGQWVTDGPHVNVIARDPNFKVFEGTRAELDALIVKHAADVKNLREAAAALGMTVSHRGELQPPKRR